MIISWLHCCSSGNWFNVIPDILFIMVLLRMAHQEARELLPAIAGGMDGIKDYFKFWNLVDWSLGGWNPWNPWILDLDLWVSIWFEMFLHSKDGTFFMIFPYIFPHFQSPGMNFHWQKSQYELKWVGSFTPVRADRICGVFTVYRCRTKSVCAFRWVEDSLLKGIFQSPREICDLQWYVLPWDCLRTSRQIVLWFRGSG